jgi:Mn-containing catalase
MHLKPLKSDRRAAHADPLIAIAGGGGVALFNSMGDAWTADYLKITGELDVIFTKPKARPASVLAAPTRISN